MGKEKMVLVGHPVVNDTKQDTPTGPPVGVGALIGIVARGALTEGVTLGTGVTTEADGTDGIAETVATTEIVVAGTGAIAAIDATAGTALTTTIVVNATIKAGATIGDALVAALGTVEIFATGAIVVTGFSGMAVTDRTARTAGTTVRITTTVKITIAHRADSGLWTRAKLSTGSAQQWLRKPAAMGIRKTRGRRCRRAGQRR